MKTFKSIGNTFLLHHPDSSFIFDISNRAEVRDLQIRNLYGLTIGEKLDLLMKFHIDVNSLTMKYVFSHLNEVKILQEQITISSFRSMMANLKNQIARLDLRKYQYSLAISTKLDDQNLLLSIKLPMYVDNNMDDNYVNTAISSAVIEKFINDYVKVIMNGEQNDFSSVLFFDTHKQSSLITKLLIENDYKQIF